MRVCYIVNSVGEDIYLDMTYVSARFFRTVNPASKIICVVDRDTARYVERTGHVLAGAVDIIHGVDTPPGSMLYKNRWLNTRLRDLVDGDLIYVDGDTLCVRSLAPLWEMAQRHSFDVAMVRDLNIRFAAKSRKYSLSRHHWPELKPFNWICPREGYFNRGVLFLRDSVKTREFGGMFHEFWLQSCSTGKFLDQPAFNHALAKSGVKIRVLGSAYNAMVMAAPRTVSGARLMHIFTSKPGAFEGTVLHQFVEEVRRNGSLSDQSIRGFLSDPFPWSSAESFKQFCIGKSPGAAWPIIVSRALRRGQRKDIM